MSRPTDALGAGPELVPARMLNEFVYCPRLFYIEWVDRRWADNPDTEAGRRVHRAVDRPSTGAFDSAVEDLQRDLRSVEVVDEDLGVVAVIDRIVNADGSLIPIELKRGKAPDGGAVWPADRVQVLAHVVLLRRAGHRVAEARVYYTGSNAMIPVDVGGDIESEVMALVASAREVAELPDAPLPLVDSPKCPRCSLATLCLPDETNALRQRSQMPPRRIVPRDNDQRPVYVSTQGARVGVEGDRLRVTKDRENLGDMRLIDVAHLAVFGNVSISATCLARLWAAGAPVLWFTYGGWLRGWAQGEPSGHVELRRRQVLAHSSADVRYAAPMIHGKITNQRVLLRRNARSDVTPILEQLDRLRRAALTARGLEELRGFEGTAARLYFGAFPLMLGTQAAGAAAAFQREGRQRRPPPDPVNALLGFTYALLVKDLVATCLAVGLDPYLGVLHRSRYGRPSLALDLAEEFRPLIADSVVLQVLNNAEIMSSDFVTSTRGVGLTQEGRRAVVGAYERRLEHVVRHPVFRYQISYRRVLDVQARILAGTFIGEIPDYVPMTTR